MIHGFVPRDTTKESGFSLLVFLHISPHISFVQWMSISRILPRGTNVTTIPWQKITSILIYTKNYTHVSGRNAWCCHVWSHVVTSTFFSLRSSTSARINSLFFCPDRFQFIESFRFLQLIRPLWSNKKSAKFREGFFYSLQLENLVPANDNKKIKQNTSPFWYTERVLVSMYFIIFRFFFLSIKLCHSIFLTLER